MAVMAAHTCNLTAFERQENYCGFKGQDRLQTPCLKLKIPHPPNLLIIKVAEKGQCKVLGSYYVGAARYPPGMGKGRGTAQRWRQTARPLE